MFSVFVARANVIIHKLARANIWIELNWIECTVHVLYKLRSIVHPCNNRSSPQLLPSGFHGFLKTAECSRLFQMLYTTSNAWPGVYDCMCTIVYACEWDCIWLKVIVYDWIWLYVIVYDRTIWLYGFVCAEYKYTYMIKCDCIYAKTSQLELIRIPLEYFTGIFQWNIPKDILLKLLWLVAIVFRGSPSVIPVAVAATST